MRGSVSDAIRSRLNSLAAEPPQVHFWDFFCPHRQRPLAVATRFGGNFACSIGGLMLYPPRAQVIRWRGVANGATRPGLNAPSHGLQALSRCSGLLSASLSVSLRHPLSVMSQRYGQVGLPCIKALLSLLAARGATLPRQRQLPSNWRGQYPHGVGELRGVAARPRRPAPPSNCASPASMILIASKVPDVISSSSTTR